MDEQVEGIRWGRALLAALLIEVLLGVVAVPAYLMSRDPGPILDLIVPPATFAIAVLVVAWLFRRAARPVANGVVTGFLCIALYVILGVTAYLLAPNSMNLDQSLGIPYLASHVLKVLGGAAGGYWIARRRTAPAS
jgi:hypothetical protein